MNGRRLTDDAPATALLDHLLGSMLVTVKRPPQIDGEDAIKVFDRS